MAAGCSADGANAHADAHTHTCARARALTEARAHARAPPPPHVPPRTHEHPQSGFKPDPHLSVVKVSVGFLENSFRISFGLLRIS